MRYHGKKGQVKLGADTATATAVASLNKWSLNAATDKADVTAFGDTNKQYVQGLPDLKGSLGGWFDDAEEAMWEAAEGGIPVFLELLPASDKTVKWSGLAYLDCSIDVPATGPVAISGDFVAAGPWTRDFGGAATAAAPTP